ncbi:nSTAND1 domain-containing NTPase, partial [Leptothoe kymatousa]
MPETPLHQNQEALDELCRLMRFSQGEFALILAVCNSTNHRQILVNQLRQQCPIGFDEITLAPTASTLFTTVNAYLRTTAASPDALMVYGLSAVADPEHLLTATNQIREEFREFEFPLILWLTDDDQKHLIRTAPDFYTWANPITFDTPPAFFLSFIDELIENVWQRVTQSQENRFLTTQDLGLTANSANYRELETSLAALSGKNIQLSPVQAADLEFVKGRIADNNSSVAREHYDYSLDLWKALVTGKDDDPAHQEKMGHVQFYMGLWWRNYAERYRPDFDLAFNNAREYFSAAIETLEGMGELGARDPAPSACGISTDQGPSQGEDNTHQTLARGQILAARYQNYLAESLHRLEAWDELELVATKAKRLHQQLQHPFRVARAEGFLAEVALAKADWPGAQRHAEQALTLIQPANPSPTQPDKAEFYRWVNSFHRSWYLFSLGKAQCEQGHLDAAVPTLEEARTITQPDYDPQLYSLILAKLQQCYFQQGLYLPAFETRRQRDAIDSRFNYRAFVGAGRLQPKQQIANPALPTETQDKDVIVASGRKQDVHTLVQRLGQDEYVLTIVYGPSGVGKSSLIEAGLVPALEQERIDTRRVVPVYLRRYRNWVEDLVQQLDDLEAGVSAYRSDVFSYPPEVLDTQADSAAPEQEILPAKVLRRLKHHTHKNQVLVLVFDQFEEFFFEFERTAERREFYDFLANCLGTPYVKVVLSLREDYIHYLLECDRLTKLDIVDNNILDKKWLYYVGNFKPDETKVIFNDLTDPTPYTPEQDLVDKVVDDLAAGAGEVRPIELQIVGAQLQAEGITTPEVYYNWGDPQQPTKELLVQKYLTDIVDECGPQEHQDLANMLLYLLTDEKGTRPLKTESDLADDLKTMTNRGLDRDLLSLILKILTESGLVMEVPEAPEERYQLVHDYLAAFIRSLQQPLLVRIEEEQKKRETAEQRQIEEQKKRLKAEQRQRKQAQLAAAGLAVITLVAVGAASVAGIQQRKAVKGERKAVNAALLADRLTMQAYLSANLEKDAVFQAVLTGQAFEAARSDYLEKDTRFRISSNMREAIYDVKERERLIGHSSRVSSVAFSPDGETLASASEDNTVKLWSKDGEELNTLKGHSSRVLSVAFSPDGETLASASEDNTVKLWSKDGEELNTLKGHSSRVWSVAFSPDGETLASASSDNTVKLWSKDGEELNTLKGHSSSVRSVAFSPDGETLASASSDNTVKLWSKDGEELNTLKGHSSRVWSVAFSPDGETLASASEDNTVKLWSKDGEEL